MRVQIQLRATKLTNVAGIFKGISDPYAVVTLASSEEELGRTTSVKNCLSPEWVEPVFFDYPDPHENIYVLVHIWDDNRGKSEDVIMGKAMVNLKPALDHPETNVMEELEGGGRIEIHVVPSKKNNTNFTFQMRALDVKNVEKGILGFGRTDPYLEIAKEYSYPSIGSKHIQTVYRSEVIHNHLNPLWEKSDVNLEVLCDGDLDMPLRVSIWDYSSSKRTMIGTLDTNLKGLMSYVATNGNADRSKSFEFFSGEFRHRKTVGHLIVMEARLSE